MVSHVTEKLTPIIVVGAGPVGIRFVEELCALSPNQPVKLFTGEAFKPYDRVKLSQLLARDIKETEIYTPVASSPTVTLFENCPVVEISPETKQVKDAEGNTHDYLNLVLALGSDAYVPNIPNADIRNTFTFRDMKDTEALFARNITSRHTVILGGGLLGLETARAMQRNGTKVTVIQLAKHLMNRQLDDKAGELLGNKVESMGIDVICSTLVKEIIPDEYDLNTSRPYVGGVLLDNGQVLKCDTVIIATGIKPRTALAQKAGLSIGRGVTVNSHLQTSDNNIYAIGECAQYEEQIFGLVAPGWEHASVAAHHIISGQADYKGTINASALKVVGEKVFSVGEVNQEVSQSIRRDYYFNKAQGIYRAVFSTNNRLVGALAIGNWSEQNRVRASISEDRKIYFWHRILFKLTGHLWKQQSPEDISSWPANMVVCNCTGTTRGQLSAAKKAGATSLVSLKTATRASTVCGSCEPLLSQFVGETPSGKKQWDLAWLKSVSIFSVILLGLYFIFGPVPFSHSVQQFQPDQLWLNSFTKQLTGFIILGIGTFSLLMSLNKRLSWFNLGSFGSWRLFHTVLGLLAIGMLLAHTGMNLGDNLNQWLMINFLALLLLGGLAGIVISNESWLPARQAKKVRSYFTWAHTLLFWPLPALLAFHILSVYYF